MRHFYLFKIRREYVELTKDKDYLLYNSLESIYKLKNDYLGQVNNFYKQIREKLNQDKISSYLYEMNKDKFSYTKIRNRHMINNYFTSERTTLEVNKTYMYLETNYCRPSLLLNLNESNLFICDFRNKDFFWLDDFSKSLANL